MRSPMEIGNGFDVQRRYRPGVGPCIGWNRSPCSMLHCSIRADEKKAIGIPFFLDDRVNTCVDHTLNIACGGVRHFARAVGAARRIPALC